jgi:hypothetical protein
MRRQKPAPKGPKPRGGPSAMAPRTKLRVRSREAIQIAFALGPLPFAFCLAPSYEPARRT